MAKPRNFLLTRVSPSTLVPGQGTTNWQGQYLQKQLVWEQQNLIFRARRYPETSHLSLCSLHPCKPVPRLAKSSTGTAAPSSCGCVSTESSRPGTVTPVFRNHRDSPSSFKTAHKPLLLLQGTVHPSDRDLLPTLQTLYFFLRGL